MKGVNNVDAPWETDQDPVDCTQWKPESKAVYALLTQLADIVTDDDIPVTEALLEAGAFGECQALSLQAADTVESVLQRARYEIARTITVVPRGPQDPVVGAVLEILGHHPAQVQARILRAAARFLGMRRTARPLRTGAGGEASDPSSALPPQVPSVRRYGGRAGVSHADVVDTGTGQVRVLERRCGTCIFRPGDPMHLGAARTRQVIEENLRAGALLTCHTTLPYGPHPDFGPAVCAGFWARHRNDVPIGRLAELLLGILRIPPPDHHNDHY
jgi:hypothetical protein